MEASSAPFWVSQTLCASEDGKHCVVRAGTIADNLPSEAATHLSKGAGLSVAKHDGVLGVKGDNEVITVGSKSHQPLRTFSARGQSDFPESSGVFFDKRIAPASVARRISQRHASQTRGVTPWETRITCKH